MTTLKSILVILVVNELLGTSNLYTTHLGPLIVGLKMKKKTILIVVVASLLTIIFAVILPVVFLSETLGVNSTQRKYVAFLEISGVISYEDSPISLLGGKTISPKDVRYMIDRVKQDPSIGAVVMVINSPGGSAVASEEIFYMVRELSEEKPVVAYISEYGASGGYYISLPADEIISSPSGLTGSVGAVSIMLNYANLSRRLGIDVYVFKSGGFKDIGNPFRELDDRELEILQSLVDSIAGQFVDRVRMMRGDKIKDWEEVLTARPFTGEQALEVGLVDKVGMLEDAKREAIRLAGLPEDAPSKWIRPRSPSLLELLLGGGFTLWDRKIMRINYEILLMWPLPDNSNFLTILYNTPLQR